MIFWNVGKLVTKLKYDTLSELEKVKYLIGFFILMMPNLVVKIQDLYHLNYSYLIELGFCLLITIIGTHACFKVNESGDNTHFVERFICLGFPIYFRLFIAAFVWQYFHSVVLRFLDAFFILEHRLYMVEDILNLGATLIINLIFFIWMKRYIFSVAQVSKHVISGLGFKVEEFSYKK